MTDLHETAPHTGNGQPPQDIVAEQGTLGSMLLSADALSHAAQILRAPDFYRPAHMTLFTTMVEMFTRGVPVEPITVVSQLIEAGDVDRVGGPPYIATLVEHARPESVGVYAASVADRATERRMIEHGERALMLARTPGGASTKLAMLRESADAVGEHRERSPGAWAGDLISGALDAIDVAAAGSGGQIIPTGYADLDRLLGGGLRPGQLGVVAGRPGQGKSTVGLDWARHAAIRCDVTSAIISLEMSDAQIMSRLLSAESQVPLAAIRTGSLTAREMARVIDQVQPIADAPLRFLSSPGTGMAQIRSEARRLKHLHDLRLLVIDYLQLIPSAGRVESRQQFVADLSRAMKILAMELGLAVVMASQLNRGPEQRQDKRPSLGDLRESGAIEQDVDWALLLHDPNAAQPEGPRQGEMDLILAKHRDGPTGTVTMANRLHVAQFADLAIV